MRFQTAAAGLALSAAAVSGFVSPPQTTASRRHGVRPARVSPSLATPDRIPTARAATSMSLKPSRKQRFLPPWARPAASARGFGRGFGRGFSLLRGAAAEGEDEEEMYEYEDGDGEEYSDGEEELDRCKLPPPPLPKFQLKCRIHSMLEQLVFQLEIMHHTVRGSVQKLSLDR